MKRCLHIFDKIDMGCSPHALFSQSRKAKIQFFVAWFLDSSIWSAKRNKWRHCASFGQMTNAQVLKIYFRNLAPRSCSNKPLGGSSTSVGRHSRLSRLSCFRVESIHDPEEKAYQQ